MFGVTTGVEPSLSSLIGLTPSVIASFLCRARYAELLQSETSEVPGDGDLDCGIWNNGGLSASKWGENLDHCCRSDAVPSGKPAAVPTIATSREDLRGTWPMALFEALTASDDDRVWLLELGTD